MPTAWLGLFGAGILSRPEPAKAKATRGKRKAVVDDEMDAEDETFDDDADDDEDRGMPFLGAMTHLVAVGAGLRRRRVGDRQILPRVKREEFDDGLDDLDVGETRPRPRRAGLRRPDRPCRTDARRKSSKTNSKTSTSVPLPTSPPPSKRVGNPGPGPKPGSRVSREAQRSLDPVRGLRDAVAAFPRRARKTSSAMPRSRRMRSNRTPGLLEGVLEDFGVKGEIIQVRPGPVVTLYELEPLPGSKSSRVIGLADDIARSMSAIACRVAVVPGRNAIGIELPNSSRETVYLRELLASREFRDHQDQNWPWRWASPSMARR